MWETAVAFAIWGSYGSLLTAARIDPVLTAIVRSAAVGAILVAASAAIARVAGPRDITAKIPWRSGILWLSGAVLLVDEVLYSVSAVSGPVAIIGLAYGCVPVIAPLLSRLAGTDGGMPMGARQWICLALAFVGNALIVSVLHAVQIQFTAAAVFAAFAALLFTALPVCAARLQQRGLGPWAILKGQGATAAILSVPLLMMVIAVRARPDTSGTTVLARVVPSFSGTVARSIALGCFNAAAFTLVPFFLWYRGIARCGVARTSICCFAEPLVATVFSLAVLHDAPADPALLAGAAIVLGAVVVSARSSDTPK